MLQKDVFILGIAVDLIPFDPTDDDVLKGTRGVYAGFSRHLFRQNVSEQYINKSRNANY